MAASNFTRRDFLTLAAGAAALELGLSPGASATARSLPPPREAPFDTVVVLMMENRSFDHVLGWLPGADGRQQGLRFADIHGVIHETRRLAPDWQGCALSDPDHTWQGAATQYADGRCDGFLKTAPAGDHFPSAITARTICPSCTRWQPAIRPSIATSPPCRDLPGRIGSIN
jgi:phospholipase C